MVSFNDKFHLYRLHTSERKGDHEWWRGGNVSRGVLGPNLRTAQDEDHNNPRSERPLSWPRLEQEILPTSYTVQW